jgi:hypothetical protein
MLQAQSMREALVCGAVCLAYGWIIPHIISVVFPGAITELLCIPTPADLAFSIASKPFSKLHGILALPHRRL